MLYNANFSLQYTIKFKFSLRNYHVPNVAVRLCFGNHFITVSENDHSGNVRISPRSCKSAVHRIPVYECTAAKSYLLVISVLEVIAAADKSLTRICGVLEEAAVDLNIAVDAVKNGSVSVGGGIITVVDNYKTVDSLATVMSKETRSPGVKPSTVMESALSERVA